MHPGRRRRDQFAVAVSEGRFRAEVAMTVRAGEVAATFFPDPAMTGVAPRRDSARALHYLLRLGYSGHTGCAVTGVGPDGGASHERLCDQFKRIT
jgi:hypothetical protein